MAFRAALIGVPAGLCVLFANVDWYWQALGWAGIVLVALVSVMMVAVIGLVLDHTGVKTVRAQLAAQNDILARLQQTSAITYDLAEATWCESRRDQLLDRHRALNAKAWDKTVRAYKETSATDAVRDYWTPAAEEAALWAQRHLPALYIDEDLGKPPHRAAPGESEVPDIRRKDYRALYGRKEMMDRYVGAIVAKLEARAGELRAQIALAGSPLAVAQADSADDAPDYDDAPSTDGEPGPQG